MHSSQISSTAGQSGERSQDTRRNGFGALRLLFASLVILSHSPEMLTGDSSLELLHRVFGTMSFGELSVDCFFLISGYLITSSMISNPVGYLKRRISRIYPGFLVCTLFCIVIAAPLAGYALSVMPPSEWALTVLRALLLQSPHLDGLPTLNNSMWTISYEFRCYLLTYFLGHVGALRNKRLMVALAGSALVLYLGTLIHPLPRLPAQLGFIIGQPNETMRLLCAYLVGASFRITGIAFRPRLALIALAALPVLMFSPLLAQPALIVLGGYALFTCAFHIRSRAFRAINSSEDISYGIYLYAFPIGKLLFWYIPTINVWLHAAITVVLSAPVGWASWHLIEKPAMRVTRRLEWPAVLRILVPNRA